MKFLKTSFKKFLSRVWDRVPRSYPRSNRSPDRAGTSAPLLISVMRRQRAAERSAGTAVRISHGVYGWSRPLVFSVRNAYGESVCLSRSRNSLHRFSTFFPFRFFPRPNIRAKSPDTLFFGKFFSGKTSGLCPKPCLKTS